MMTEEERNDELERRVNLCLKDEDWIANWVELNQELIVGCLLRDDEFINQMVDDAYTEVEAYLNRH